MNGIIHFDTFLFTGILLNLTPGNDTIFILTRSISEGKKAGIVSALGISTGSVIQTILAAFGLSIIIAKSIFLFNLIKYAGAVYLIYIGVNMLLVKNFLTANIKKTNVTNYLKIYREAIITNLLNPKVALFFIAFLPQFIDPLSKNTVLAFLTLGFTFTTTGTIWCFILAIFASAIFVRLKRNAKVSAYITKFCGFTLIALGIKVAMINKK